MDIPLKESQLRKAEHIFNCNRDDAFTNIQKTFHVLANKYHPDRIGENPHIKDVNESYESFKRYKELGRFKVINDCINTNFHGRDCYSERDELLDSINDFVGEMGLKKENLNVAISELKPMIKQFMDIFTEEAVSPFLVEFLFKNKKTSQKKSGKEILFNIFDQAKDKLNSESKDIILKYINNVFGWNFKLDDFDEKPKKSKSKAKPKPKPNTPTEKAFSLKFKSAITTVEALSDLAIKKKGSYFCFVESESTGITVEKLLNLYLIEKKLENNRAILICRDKNNIIYRVSTG